MESPSARYKNTRLFGQFGKNWGYFGRLALSSVAQVDTTEYFPTIFPLETKMSIKSHRMRFRGSLDCDLVGQLDTPASPTAYCVFAHCFTCGKDIKFVSRMSRALARAGMACFRFDFPGIGESSGEFADSTVSSRVEDVQLATQLVSEQFGNVQFLLGHSLGGCCALLAGESMPQIAGVVAIASPSSTHHLRDTLLSLNPNIEADGEGQVTIGPMKVLIRDAFLENLAVVNLAASLESSTKHHLIIHSRNDHTVPFSHAAKLEEICGENTRLLELIDSDHLFTSSRDEFTQLTEQTIHWMKARMAPQGPAE